MPRYFFDTSALVKHYHSELGSPEVDAILGEVGSEFWISRLTLAEAPSAFAKKVRTGELSEIDFERLRLRFFDDIRNRMVTPVRILNAHFQAAGDLIATHGKTRQIYTLDSLQLAVALSIQQPAPIDRFVCADQRLCEIARIEGLAVLNPEQP
jgi:uncharacterized protein